MRLNQVKVGISNRHLHLCQNDLEILFGKNYQLNIKQYLTQPEQFAAHETVSLIGPRGKIEAVRVVGPVRSFTQVELSLTDARLLGIKPPLRLSGDLTNSLGITIVGTVGQLTLNSGVIIAKRHLHLHSSQALALGLSAGQAVSIVCEGERALVFHQVIVRPGDKHQAEFHLDTDEANAANLVSGDLVTILLP